MDRLLVQFQTDETNAQLIAPRCRSRIRRCECSKQASRCRNSQKQKSHFRSEARTVWRSAKKPRVEERAACCYHMAQGYGEPKVRSSRPGGRRCSEWPGVFRKPRGPCAPRRRRWPFVTTTAPSRRPSSLFLVSRRQGPYNFLDLLSICLYFT
jgi:hypothetical protein